MRLPAPGAGIIGCAMDLYGGFRVGEWDVLPLSGDIRSASASVHLEPKVMEVLVALAERAESVVLRDELLEKIWGERAAVADEPLTRCIAQLRQGFGDSSRSPLYIQTVPKRGYRLMQPVFPIAAVSPAAASPVSERLAAPAAPAISATGRWRGVASIAILLLLIYGAYVMRGALDSSGAVAVTQPAATTAVVDARCDLEAAEAPDRQIQASARQNCLMGLAELDRRDEDDLRNAIEYFRRAIDEQPDYGSAIVNLARAIVLYPTYDVTWIADDCAVAPIVTDPADCFAAALELLENRRVYAEYIDKYTLGIRAYIATRQHRWLIARGYFADAAEATLGDPDMWQWYSQFSASVGDLNSALDQARKAYELNPRSPVNLDRLIVVLMWTNNMLEAMQLSELRANDPLFVSHNPYPPSELVLDVRKEEWDELKRKLRGRADLRVEESAWIDDFVRGIQRNGDDAQAVAAVQLAIRNRWLDGQLVYGAWVYLKEPDKAIDAALDLIRRGEPFDPEFLFVDETEVLRASPRFGDLLEELRLRDYWAYDGGICPAVFDAGQRAAYCED